MVIKMKLNENYVLKTVAGTPVVVPVGEAVKNIKGMITLNGAAELIWKALEQGKSYEEIVALLKAEYDAPEDVLRNDLTAFLDKLESYKILEK